MTGLRVRSDISAMSEAIRRTWLLLLGEGCRRWATSAVTRAVTRPPTAGYGQISNGAARRNPPVGAVWWPHGFGRVFPGLLTAGWYGSAGVVFGDRGEGGFWLPGHVGVGVAVAAVEDLDDPEAGEVEVVAGVAVGAVGQVVEGE